MKPGRLDVMGRRVNIKEDYLKNCTRDINEIVEKIATKLRQTTANPN